MVVVGLIKPLVNYLIVNSMNIQDTIMPILRKAETLGTEKLDDGTLLIGRVPHIAPLARLHIVPGGLREEGIALLEDHINRKIPNNYRDFLRQTNGLHVYSDAISLDGLRTNYARDIAGAWQPFSLIEPNTYERPRDAKDSYLFIGGYGYDGSSLFVDSDSGKVYRCAQKYASEIFNVWPDFWTMLTSEVERLDGLFDAEGKKKYPDRPTTPEPNINI